MRALMVRPGPHFSVADVHRGWAKALKQLGCQLVDFNFDDRLDFYVNAKLEKDGELRNAFEVEAAARMAAKGIEVACYEFWPDVVIIVSGFFVPPETYALMRSRGHKLVFLATESPYEDDRQIAVASHCDVALINDPTNLERFRAVNPNTFYVPHAYDPEIHHPGPADPDKRCDVAFVGTGFPSRIDFLEQVDWDGLDVTLGGHWQLLDEDSPLRPLVKHPIEHCLDNVDTADLYRSCKASLNLYRQEAQRPELSEGWAMGPREVELAATGTFFLRDRRPESDETFPMLPAFTEPDEVRPLLDWWLTHDTERDEAAAKARAAIEQHTFENHAAFVLEHLS